MVSEAPILIQVVWKSHIIDTRMYARDSDDSNDRNDRNDTNDNDDDDVDFDFHL
jgi:hypothetical protein